MRATYRVAAAGRTVKSVLRITLGRRRCLRCLCSKALDGGPGKDRTTHAEPASHSNPAIQNLVREYLSRAASPDPTSDQEYTPADGSKGIFANNPISFQSIDVIGMDYDYTLVSYTHALEELIYDGAKNYLVDEFGFPAELKKCRYDADFAIRGLAVDIDKGLLLKLSYIHQIAPRQVFRGRHALTEEAAAKEYRGSMHVSPEYRDRHFRPLMDIFSMSEATLLADVVEFFIQNNISFYPRAVVEDVHKAVDYMHSSGSMHRKVLENPAQYMNPAPHLKATLQRFRDVGKKLFLCSNSSFKYVNGGLKYLIGPDWRELFDVVMVSARKPTFYTAKRPFREIDLETGKISWTQVQELKKGNVYTHGSLSALTAMTGWKGPRVLYMGDSLWADLVDARRLQGWRTGAVIRELDNELDIQQSARYRTSVQKLSAVTELLRLVQTEMEKSRQIKSADQERPWKYADSEEDLQTLSFLERYLKQLNAEISTLFNSNYGSVFRTGGEPTLFAFSLRRYVDIYMSTLENLRFYSPNHRFYPERGGSMPHDPRFNRRRTYTGPNISPLPTTPADPTEPSSEKRSSDAVC